MGRPGRYDTQLYQLAQGPTQKLGEIGNERANVGRLGIERLAAAKCEQLGGQLGSVLRGVPRVFQNLALTRVLKTAFEHFEISGNHCQQIIEVVGDAPGQLTNSLHLL